MARFAEELAEFRRASMKVTKTKSGEIRFTLSSKEMLEIVQHVEAKEIRAVMREAAREAKAAAPRSTPTGFGLGGSRLQRNIERAQNSKRGLTERSFKAAVKGSHMAETIRGGYNARSGTGYLRASFPAYFVHEGGPHANKYGRTGATRRANKFLKPAFDKAQGKLLRALDNAVEREAPAHMREAA